MKPNFGKEPMLIDGKVTFAGVLDRHWDEIAKYWNENTQEAYARDYKDLILPHFRLQYLEYYDNTDQFDSIIAEIKQGGTRRYGKKSEYSEATLRHYRHLMRRVIKIASLHGICPDVLWGTNYVDAEKDDPDQTVVEERTRLQKSLLPREEYALADLIFTDSLQPGEHMVALLGLAHGTRPQEAAAPTWGDILPVEGFPGKYVLAILTTASRDGTKLGGKTKSMYRFSPISEKEYSFLMERKSHIQSQIDSGILILDSQCGITSINQLPIACEGRNFAKRCNLRKASNICKDLLRSIGVSETLYRYLTLEAAGSKDISVWGRERDVTLYLLRRNYGTHLHNLGLSMAEIQYLMGHKISNPLVKRSDFRNPDVMSSLWDKLALRPILNDLPTWDDNEFVF